MLEDGNVQGHPLMTCANVTDGQEQTWEAEVTFGNAFIEKQAMQVLSELSSTQLVSSP